MASKIPAPVSTDDYRKIASQVTNMQYDAAKGGVNIQMQLDGKPVNTFLPNVKNPSPAARAAENPETAQMMKNSTVAPPREQPAPAPQPEEKLTPENPEQPTTEAPEQPVPENAEQPENPEETPANPETPVAPEQEEEEEQKATTPGGMEQRVGETMSELLPDGLQQWMKSFWESYGQGAFVAEALINYFGKRNAGAANGPFEERTSKGELLARGNYKDGKLDGHYIMYYPGEKPLAEFNYQNGLLNGRYVRYYENGRVKEAGEYKDGALVGEPLKFDINGKPINGKAPEGKQGEAKEEPKPAPVGTAEKPLGAPEKPVGTTERPVGAPERPVGTTEKTVGAPERPVETTEKTVGTPERPVGTAERSAAASEKSATTMATSAPTVAPRDTLWKSIKKKGIRMGGVHWFGGQVKRLNAWWNGGMDKLGWVGKQVKRLDGWMDNKIKTVALRNMKRNTAASLYKAADSDRQDLNYKLAQLRKKYQKPRKAPYKWLPSFIRPKSMTLSQYRTLQQEYIGIFNKAHPNARADAFAAFDRVQAEQELKEAIKKDPILFAQYQEQLELDKGLKNSMEIIRKDASLTPAQRAEIEEKLRAGYERDMKALQQKYNDKRAKREAEKKLAEENALKKSQERAAKKAREREARKARKAKAAEKKEVNVAESPRKPVDRTAETIRYFHTDEHDATKTTTPTIDVPSPKADKAPGIPSAPKVVDMSVTAYYHKQGGKETDTSFNAPERAVAAQKRMDKVTAFYNNRKNGNSAG